MYSTLAYRQWDYHGKCHDETVVIATKEYQAPGSHFYGYRLGSWQLWQAIASYSIDDPNNPYPPYIVEHGGKKELFPDENSADEAILGYCLNGEACDLTDEHGCISHYDALDSAKIISLVGLENYNSMLDNEEYGYCVFYNVQEEDEDTIAEIRGEV